MTTMRGDLQNDIGLTGSWLSEVLEQSFNIIEFNLRAHGFAETTAQFVENAARALRIDLAGHFAPSGRPKSRPRSGRPSGSASGPELC